MIDNELSILCNSNSIIQVTTWNTTDFRSISLIFRSAISLLAVVHGLEMLISKLELKISYLNWMDILCRIRCLWWNHVEYIPQISPATPQKRSTFDSTEKYWLLVDWVTGKANYGKEMRRFRQQTKSHFVRLISLSRRYVFMWIQESPHNNNCPCT